MLMPWRPETLQLGNWYFDTPDQQLNQARVALRIRTLNGGFIQTLKTRGESINGLTRRGEWEWPLPEAQLNGTLLAEVWPEYLKGIDVDQLQPIFSTDFTRTRWTLHWDNPRAVIEAALDTGQVEAAGRTSPICELELELIEGDENALGAVADDLKQSIDLMPSDKSKAERGVELLTREPT
ncbi:MAG: CYTH domain-containing protein [Endozoicomonas sp.]